MSTETHQESTTPLYGYRYAPGSEPFPLHGFDRIAAAAEVCDRRSRQGKRGSAVTVELCRHTPKGWIHEPLTDPAERDAHTRDRDRDREPAAGGGETGGAQLLDGIPKLRPGRRRRPPRRH